MAFSLVGDAKINSRKNHGKDDHRQNDMGNENNKVDRANQTFSEKFGIALQAVVINIADQEHSGYTKSANHEIFMQELPPVLNRPKAHQQNDCAGGI